MKNIFLIPLLIMLFTTCNSTRTAKMEENSIAKKPLQSGDYTIVKLYDQSITESNPTINIKMAEKTMSGFSGCNTYSCSFELTSESVDFGYPMATKIYCAEQAALEKNFFKALSEVKKMEQELNELTLLDKDGKQIIFAKIQ